MIELKGYWNDYSYKGYDNSKYKEFVSDTEYYEIMEEKEDEDNDTK